MSPEWEWLELNRNSYRRFGETVGGLIDAVRARNVLLTPAARDAVLLEAQQYLDPPVGSGIPPVPIQVRTAATAAVFLATQSTNALLGDSGTFELGVGAWAEADSAVTSIRP